MSMPGFWEILVLVIIALMVFGPDRLPGLLRTVGKTVGNLRQEARTTLTELKSSSDFDELRGAAKELRGEADELRRESRQASQEVRRAARTPEGAATGPGAGSAPTRDGAANEPAPYDPDAP